MIRRRISVRGVVQGVGFRPFVQRLASEHALAGWIQNDGAGACLEVEGPAHALDAFLVDLVSRAPPAANISALRATDLPPVIYRTFRIEPSDRSAERRVALPPDLAPCSACAGEARDPTNRRYRYPFTHCTECGPRHSIVRGVPYDRERTSLADFVPCAECRAEYLDPSDRRFHAEAIACPACGPTLSLSAPDGRVLASAAEAIEAAGQALARGEILALESVGGYQLLALATNPTAVAALRTRKQRPHKPFAVLFPSFDVLQHHAFVSSAERAALESRAAPIVLLRRRRRSGEDALADAVAPGNPWLGAMLPPSLVHALLSEGLGAPVVCTSGNRSEEPLALDASAAHARLAGIADLFLEHDRAIERPLDDSVLRLTGAGPRILRRARGFAPRTVARPGGAPSVLALGGHLKNTVSLAVGDEILVSQHLGDLDTLEARAVLESTVDDLLALYGVTPEVVVCDAHPDYASTLLAERLGRRWGVPVEHVQHHHAHLAACLAEHGLSGRVLGFAWDGTGYGGDGGIWGGETLLTAGARAEHVARLRPFPLVGGDRAARDPRRSALGVCHALFGADLPDPVARTFSASELRVLLPAIEAAPYTTSVGRLFDAVACLLGFSGPCTFEAQAALELEFLASEHADAPSFPSPVHVQAGGLLVLDWEPLIRGLLDGVARRESRALLSARFHATLAELCREVAERRGTPEIVLSGGCFQNQELASRVERALSARGYRAFLPSEFPCNDGGLSLGQAWIVTLRHLEKNDVPRDPR